ncbi:tetratricopeptide repeat protein [Sulfuricurvum sp.]|uniref:tetratricopeptide repeat protein n=1 Tax=Sulfuricurvum sp. TaxID=2025608 RepID=UPI00356860DA
MQGKILDYNNEMKSGFLRDDNGHKYHFFIGDCTNPEKLQAGSYINFEHDGERATTITILDPKDDIAAVNAKFIKTEAAKKSKRIISTIMIIGLVLGVGGFIVTIILSEIETRQSEKLQLKYESQISNIQKDLNAANCSDAALEYALASDTRKEIYKKGAYYSFETHAQHGHGIDIAECFVKEKDFTNAVKILDIEEVNDPDYLRRAAIIYKKAGDKNKAEESFKKAKSLEP